MHEIRIGQECATPETCRLRVSLTFDQSGAPWVTVEGEDVNQVATKISEACDALYNASHCHLMVAPQS